MAPPAKITEDREPDILPADFGEWDSGPPPTTLPDNFSDFDVAPRPPAPAAETVSPEPPASRGRASAYTDLEESSEQVQSKRAKAAEEAKRKAEAEADAKREAKAQAEARRQAEADAKAEAKAQAEARRQAEVDAKAQAKAQAEARRQAEADARAEARRQAEARKQARSEDEGKGKSKGVILAIAAVLLVGSGVYYALQLRKPATNPAATEQTVAHPAESTSPTAGAKPKPGPATPAATSATPTAATTAETADTTDQQPTAPAQSDQMRQQIEARSVIDRSSLKPGSDAGAPPPPSTNIDMGASGGTQNPFGSKPAPTVTAAPSNSNKVISVSATVMAGRAISRPQPVYPAIARNAGVTGTVVLDTTISKTGTVENVSVISGPPMLRQAALDAVKTWRFKPYLIDNEPVRVETTVSVGFVLGG